MTDRPMNSGVPWRVVVPTGIGAGIVYALSPLTVLVGIWMVFLVRWAVRGTSGDERRWLLVLLVGAIALRVAAVGGLFVLTSHAQVPFGSFFGDEEYFIKRSIWLRNVASDVPIHGADLIYAFDYYSDTSYLYLLAFVQFLVGTAPYGVHLLGIAFYLSGAVVLFRLARASFGSAAAFGGLALTVCMPTLFAWSISALKDPLFFFLSAVSLLAGVRIVRAYTWRGRIAAAVAVGSIAVVLDTIRQAGAVLTLASVSLGLVIAALLRRPWVLIAAIVATPIIAGAALSRPAVQVRAFEEIQRVAVQHWGHVATPGWVYQTLDSRFYADQGTIGTMQPAEALRFVIRAIERYVTVPLPWEVRSTAALAYMPEQLVWYGIALLLLPGIVFALRRDPLVAAIFVGYSLVAAALIALTSGNVGTLIRHRGLALPYIVWLSAVGACELVARVSRHAAEPRLRHPDALVRRIDPLCP